jgi:hypothetical protein
MVPSPSTTTRYKTCRRRAMNWSARTSHCAKRTKVCRCQPFEYLLGVPCSSLTFVPEFFADLEARVEKLKASEIDMKNLLY